MARASRTPEKRREAADDGTVEYEETVHEGIERALGGVFTTGRSKNVLLALLVLSGSLAGCAAAGSGTGGTESSPDVLVSSEIRAAEAREPDLYSFIQRLRPSWLRARASTVSGERPLPNVFVDGVYYGGVGTLRSIDLSEVVRVEYLSAPETTIRFGGGFPGAGAILVDTR